MDTPAIKVSTIHTNNVRVSIINKFMFPKQLIETKLFN